jgi:very-short-patch-repair endonuclease
MREKNIISISEYRECNGKKKLKPKSETHIPSNVWTALGLPVPEVEYLFYPGRKWRIDYAWVSERMAVEIEGGLFSRTLTCHRCKEQVMTRDKNGEMRVFKFGGAHSSSRFKSDIMKYNHLSLEGWTLLRFEPEGIQFSFIVDLYKKLHEKKR